MSKPFLLKLDELKSRRAMRLIFVQEGVEKEGFAIAFEGRVRAYENRCRHLSLPLDYEEERFFDAEGRHLVCHHHGAIFDPLTGLCLRGPCAGASLTPLRLKIADGEVCSAGWDPTSQP